MSNNEGRVEGMQFVIQRMEFVTNEITFLDEDRFAVWSGEPKKIEEFETDQILVTGILANNGARMQIQGAFVYSDFKDLSLEEIKQEIKRLTVLNFSDKDIFNAELRRRSIAEAKAEGGTVLDE